MHFMTFFFFFARRMHRTLFLALFRQAFRADERDLFARSPARPLVTSASFWRSLLPLSFLLLSEAVPARPLSPFIPRSLPRSSPHPVAVREGLKPDPSPVATAFQHGAVLLTTLPPRYCHRCTHGTRLQNVLLQSVCGLLSLSHPSTTIFSTYRKESVWY